MSVLKEVLEELWSMFVGDRRLTLLALAVVALAAVIATVFAAHATLAADVLLVGAVLVLADAVFAAARKTRQR
jgi:hypothetical protein